MVREGMQTAVAPVAGLAENGFRGWVRARRGATPVMFVMADFGKIKGLSVPVPSGIL